MPLTRALRWFGRVPLPISVVLGLALLLSSGCGVFGDNEKPTIRLHSWGHNSGELNNAIAAFMIEHGYGYPVESVAGTTPVLLERLASGELDLLLEGWQQNVIDWYEEQIEAGKIVNLGMIIEAGPQFFVIPTWVSEQYGIRTVFDMRDRWELFGDPDDPSKGLFYNCLIGWGCHDINLVKLEAYGLVRYYNAVSPGSSDALEAALSRAQDRNRPVFGYYWAPTALMGSYDWYVLEEPAHTTDCWQRTLAAAAGEGATPSETCAYESVPIDVLAWSGLADKAPDVYRMIGKMFVGLEPLNRTLAWAAEQEVDDWHRVAVYYLQQFDDRWRSWVTPEAAERIADALVVASRR